MSVLPAFILRRLYVTGILCSRPEGFELADIDARRLDLAHRLGEMTAELARVGNDRPARGASVLRGGVSKTSSMEPAGLRIGSGRLRCSPQVLHMIQERADAISRSSEELRRPRQAMLPVHLRADRPVFRAAIRSRVDCELSPFRNQGLMDMNRRVHDRLPVHSFDPGSGLPGHLLIFRPGQTADLLNPIARIRLVLFPWAIACQTRRQSVHPRFRSPNQQPVCLMQEPR